MPRRSLCWPRDRAFVLARSTVLSCCGTEEKAMPRYTTSDLSRRSGDIIAAALRGPVILTQRDKPRMVLLSIEDYRRLSSGADSRKAATLATMLDEDFADFRRAVDAYAVDDGEG